MVLFLLIPQRNRDWSARRRISTVTSQKRKRIFLWQNKGKKMMKLRKKRRKQLTIWLWIYNFFCYFLMLLFMQNNWMAAFKSGVTYLTIQFMQDWWASHSNCNVKSSKSLYELLLPEVNLDTRTESNALISKMCTWNSSGIMSLYKLLQDTTYYKYMSMRVRYSRTWAS